MGVWDLIRSIKDKLRNAADLASVKGACRSTYDYGRTAVSKIDNAVKDSVVPELKQYLPDEQGQATLGIFAKTAALYSLEEGAKLIPGGSRVYKIVKKGLNYQYPSQNSNESKKPDITIKVEEMQARMEKIQEEMDIIKQRSKTQTEDARVLEMQARMEKIQEEMDIIKQRSNNTQTEDARVLEPLNRLPDENGPSKTQTEDARALEPLNKLPDENEPIGGSAPPKTDPKRVFIRSRL